MKRSQQLLLPALLLLPVIGSYAGGWAVVTVDDLPDYIVAGTPVTLSWRVRQHGFEAHPGLSGNIAARMPGQAKTEVEATPGRERGQYTATFTLPAAGEWSIVINSGFGNSNTTLLPIQAVPAGSRTGPTLTDNERGRRLFTAKGCVTCHVAIAVGPNLAGRRYTTEYLSQWLANPTRPGAPSNTPKMPNLQLAPREIAALVAFINSGDAAGSR